MHDAGKEAGNPIALEKKERKPDGIRGNEHRRPAFNAGKMDEASSARIPAGTGHSLGTEKKIFFKKMHFFSKSLTLNGSAIFDSGEALEAGSRKVLIINTRLA